MDKRPFPAGSFLILAVLTWAAILTLVAAILLVRWALSVPI